MKLFILFLFTIICALFFSCSNSNLDGEDYVNYIENMDNGLVNEKDINKFKYHLQYCTQEYMILNELKSFNVSSRLIDLKKDTLSDLIYFKLRIQSEANDILNQNVSSKNEYYERIEYLSYGFEENIVLINPTDTIYPAIFHFERTYGIVPYVDFLIAFNGKKYLKNDFSIVLNDIVFGNGLVKMSFRKTDFDKLPKLNTN